MREGNPDHELLRLAAGIVSAHASHNGGPSSSLPDLIRSVYAALSAAGAVPVVEVRPEPAVPVNKSVFPDYIVCLEDGKKLKMLKRHLRASFGLTPEAYRTRWNLPPSYPIVAPNYASHRSTLAKSFGLGRKFEGPAEAEVPAQRIPLVAKAKRRSRSKPEVEQVAAAGDAA